MLWGADDLLPLSPKYDPSNADPQLSWIPSSHIGNQGDKHLTMHSEHCARGAWGFLHAT